METIVAQRKVNDYMSKNNFQTHMSVSKELLRNAKQAHFRHKKALDEKQNQKKKSVGAIQLEKEIAGLNARKSQLEIALEKYIKKKDKYYAFEPRNKENLRAVENFQQFETCFKEKQEELDECVKNEKEVDVEK